MPVIGKDTMKRVWICILLIISSAVASMGCKKERAGSEKSGGQFPVVTRSGIEMIFLPGGTFTMGNPDVPEEGPPHQVTVTGFLMDKYPATHELFEKFQLADGSHWKEPKTTPVETIRWREAKAYCNERSAQEGLKPCYNEKTVEWDCDYSANGYRLPAEAEWEYAARAGSDKPYDFGSAEQLGQYAWYAENSGMRTHPVGQKKPNGWGLYDMYGNVSQWCEDVYSPTYYMESSAADPTGPASPGRDVKRVMRGGNWKSGGDACRATYRRGERTGNTDACFGTSDCGVRCVRRASPEELVQLRAGK